MRKVLFTAFICICFGGLLGANMAAPESHWRNHDGHWSYYHAADKAWYYTDGVHWYCNTDGGAWTIYNFDKQFGKDGFERGDYRAPKEVKVVPTHKVPKL